MLKYQEAHLMSKRMRSEDNWKELLGKSSAKWSLMFGHLCEEPFCAEDALGSLTQVCLSPFCPKIREIGAVRLSNRGETPTPFPPLPPSSPCPGDFHRAENATRTQQHSVKQSAGWMPTPWQAPAFDKTIKISLGLNTATCTQTLSGHTDSVFAVCRLDAHTLASASETKQSKFGISPQQLVHKHSKDTPALY